MSRRVTFWLAVLCVGAVVVTALALGTRGGGHGEQARSASPGGQRLL